MSPFFVLFVFNEEHSFVPSSLSLSHPCDNLLKYLVVASSHSLLLLTFSRLSSLSVLPVVGSMAVPANKGSNFLGLSLIMGIE